MAELERVCEARSKEMAQGKARLQSLTQEVAQATQRVQEAEAQEKVGHTGTHAVVHPWL
jgi:hypothetical protein